MFFSVFSWKVDFTFLLHWLLFVKCKSFGWRESWKANLANPRNLKLAVGRDSKTSGELPSRCEHYIHSNLASPWQIEWSVLGSFEKGGPRYGQTTKGTNPIRHLPQSFLQTQQVAQRQVTGISFSKNIFLEHRNVFPAMLCECLPAWLFELIAGSVQITKLLNKVPI